jgi:hypothetical protein
MGTEAGAWTLAATPADAHRLYATNGFGTESGLRFLFSSRIFLNGHIVSVF